MSQNASFGVVRWRYCLLLTTIYGQWAGSGSWSHWIQPAELEGVSSAHSWAAHGQWGAVLGSGSWKLHPLHHCFSCPLLPGCSVGTPSSLWELSQSWAASRCACTATKKWESRDKNKWQLCGHSFPAAGSCAPHCSRGLAVREWQHWHGHSSQLNLYPSTESGLLKKAAVALAQIDAA